MHTQISIDWLMCSTAMSSHHAFSCMNKNFQINSNVSKLWSWSHSSWIYNYLCKFFSPDYFYTPKLTFYHQETKQYKEPSVYVLQIEQTWTVYTYIKFHNSICKIQRSYIGKNKVTTEWWFHEEKIKVIF